MRTPRKIDMGPIASSAIEAVAKRRSEREAAGIPHPFDIDPDHPTYWPEADVRNDDLSWIFGEIEEGENPGYSIFHWMSYTDQHGLEDRYDEESFP